MTAHLSVHPPRPHARPQVLSNLLRLSAYHDLLLADPNTRELVAPCDPPPHPLRPAVLRLLARVSLLYLRLHGIAPPAATRPLPDHFAELFTLVSLIAYPAAEPQDGLPLLSSSLLDNLSRTPPAPTLTIEHLRLLALVHRLLEDSEASDGDTVFRLALDIATHLYYLGDSTDLFLNLRPPDWSPELARHPGRSRPPRRRRPSHAPTDSP